MQIECHTVQAPPSSYLYADCVEDDPGIWS